MKVVTGVVGNDIHVVANRLIEISLQERGFTVFNLGVNTYLEEFLDALVETQAEVLLISSLNGEAEGWCRDLQYLKSSYDFENVIFVIEVKSSQSVKKEDFKHIADFQKRSDREVVGIVLYGGEDILSFRDGEHRRYALPFGVFF